MINLYYSEAYWGHSATMNGPHKVVDNLIKSLEQELFSDDTIMISEGNDADVDLCLMTKCDYHIIANSSFSWWGAWLGDSEKVVAPSNWFADSCAGKSVKDMEFSDWTWL